MVRIQLPSISEVVSGEFARIWTKSLHLETFTDKFSKESHSFITLFFICTNIAYIVSSISSTAANFCNDLLKEIRGTQLNYDPEKIVEN